MVSWGVFEATYPSLWVHHLFIVYIYITVYIYILGGVSHLVSEKLFPHIAITLKILPYIYIYMCVCVWNIPSCIWIINYLLSEMHIQAGWIEYDIEYERGPTSAKDPEVRHGE